MESGRLMQVGLYSEDKEKSKKIDKKHKTCIHNNYG